MKRTVLDNDLQALDAQVIQLGTLVEHALALALKALEESSQDKAGEVVLGDNAIDDLHLAIEEHALRILRLQQPLGGRDLRYLSSVAPIAIDLERIGDEAEGVAQDVMRMIPYQKADTGSMPGENKGSEYQLSQIPTSPKGDGLASSLDRNSADSYGSAALASSTDASGRSDNPPVLLQHAGQGALSPTENVLPQHGILAGNPGRSVGKEPVGEPSLSGEPECLSLQSSLLSEPTQSGNVPLRGLSFLPPPAGGGSPERNLDELSIVRRLLGLGREVRTVLARTMKAFEERNAPVARTIWEQDRVVDHRHYVIQRDLMEMLGGNKAIPALAYDRHVLQRVTCLLWIAHKLERASDHCTNICERIVFMVEGATDIASLPSE